jgi:hypothetical protein
MQFVKNTYNSVRLFMKRKSLVHYNDIRNTLRFYHNKLTNIFFLTNHSNSILIYCIWVVKSRSWCSANSQYFKKNSPKNVYEVPP